MDVRTLRQSLDAQQLRLIGVVLAYAVAAIHLFHPTHGFPKLVTILLEGQPSLLLTHPRPLAFVLSGFAIVVGVVLATTDVDERKLYVAGMALMAAYFLGYFAWHLSGHGGFLPGRLPLYHGLSPVEAVVAHLLSDPVAGLSKVLEAALFSLLFSLYRGAEDDDDAIGLENIVPSEPDATDSG